MDFINRHKEIELLQDCCKRKKSQFVVLYGRRRIGKTALLNHWLEKKVKKNFLYWVAHRNSSTLLLKKFSQSLIPHLNTADNNFCFSDWESAIRQLFLIAQKKKFVLVLDEFPYLLEAVPEISSLLQMIWDQNHKKSQLILVLSGSHYHMMYHEFLSGKGPLYGRSTADIHLREIEFEHLGEFLPRYSNEQLVETFSIIGGVPKYLEMWQDHQPVLKNVEQLILSPVTLFKQEAVFLIQDEIAEPRTYLAILEAMGTGIKTPLSICQTTGLAINHIGKYLKTLLTLGFIRRVIPISASSSETKQGRYEIKDPYLRFYFTFIRPHLSLQEQNRFSQLMTLIKEAFPAYVAQSGYEELCRRHITHLGDSGNLSFNPQQVGRLWNRKVEIDLAALCHKTRNLILGECKWTQRKMTESVYTDLQKKSKKLTKLKGYHIQYAFFSKTGFTAPFIKKARQDGLLLFHGVSMIPLRMPPFGV
jgi:uncharacterized protein